MRYQLANGNIVLADQSFIDNHHPDAVLLPDVVDVNTTRKQEILILLAEIDVKSDSPRARREALLGNTTWLASLNAQAVTLRTEFGTL